MCSRLVLLLLCVLFVFRRERRSLRPAAITTSTVTASAATPATLRASSVRGRRSWRRTRPETGRTTRSEEFCSNNSLGIFVYQLFNHWLVSQELTVVCPVCREPLTYDVDQLLSSPAPQLPEVTPSLYLTKLFSIKNKVSISLSLEKSRQ